MMRALVFLVAVSALCFVASQAVGDRHSRPTVSLAMTGAELASRGDDSNSARPLVGRALAFAQPESVWDQEWQKVRARIDATELVDLVFLTRGERGGEEQILHDLRRGRAHMGGMSLQGLASTVPELNIAMSPFIFSSIEEIDFVYDNYLFDVFDELFAEKNLQLLQWVEVGWNGIYAQKAIRLPADAEGLRLRGSPNPAAQLFLDAIGADSIPLGSGDLVPSLQTGLINGGVSAVIFHYFVTRRYASHVALLNHSYDTGAIVVNRDWYNSATPEQQKILSTSWGSATDARVAVRSLIDTALTTMATEGIVLVEPSSEELAIWRAATAHIPQALIDRIGGKSQEVFDAIEAGKAAYKAQQDEAKLAAISDGATP